MRDLQSCEVEIFLFLTIQPYNSTISSALLSHQHSFEKHTWNTILQLLLHLSNQLFHFLRWPRPEDETIPWVLVAWRGVMDKRIEYWVDFYAFESRAQKFGSLSLSAGEAVLVVGFLDCEL